jgi:DNA replication licensing factor MCM2
MINIRGVVTKRTAVFPELREVYQKCPRCANVLGPFINNPDQQQLLFSGACARCQYKGKMEINFSQCIYRNYQKWTL